MIITWSLASSRLYQWTVPSLQFQNQTYIRFVNNTKAASFDDLTVVVMKIQFSWDVMPCKEVKSHTCSRAV